MAIQIGTERFESMADAVNAVELNATRDIEITMDPWMCPDCYAGPMYDTEVTVTCLCFGRQVQIRYLYTDAQLAGRIPGDEDFPWDAADAELVIDDLNVLEVE